MRVLLLAGTSDARMLAQLLHGAGVQTMASFAGATDRPKSLPVPSRIGGFGGGKAQLDYLQSGEFDVIVNATHPFAAAISERTARLAKQLGLPCLRLLRPPWQAAPLDKWHEIAAPRMAADHIPPGARVFLATGRKTLADFDNLAGRHLICRVIDPPKAAFPYANGAYLQGRPPFDIDAEIATFRQHRIDWLVVKNAGGAASRAKLDAARQLRLPVLLLKRPEPVGYQARDIVPDAEAAMRWLAAMGR